MLKTWNKSQPIAHIVLKYCILTGNTKKVLSGTRSQANLNIDEDVKSQQNDGFDVGASCGRPCPGERNSPLPRVSRDNDEVEAQSRSERDRWTFYETINIGSCLNPQY